MFSRDCRNNRTGDKNCTPPIEFIESLLKVTLATLIPANKHGLACPQHNDFPALAVPYAAPLWFY